MQRARLGGRLVVTQQYESVEKQGLVLHSRPDKLVGEVLKYFPILIGNLPFSVHLNLNGKLPLLVIVLLPSRWNTAARLVLGHSYKDRRPQEGEVSLLVAPLSPLAVF
jgi:hypothetical protein